MNKKVLLVIFVIFILGAFLGVAANPPRASANFLQDLFNRLFTPQVATPPETDTQVEQEQAPAVPYSPTVDYEEAVVKAVDEGSKSVVSIIISKNLPVIEQCPYDPFSNLSPDIRQFFGEGFEFSQPCQKGTKLEKVGGGSGFIVTSDGLILTNKHVVTDTKAEYTVITYDGKKYDAKVLARDPAQDLAIIKIDAQGLTPAKLGNSDSIRLGQTAIAIGYSLGEFSNTVSVGVISGLSRTITASGKNFGTETIQGVIQTDAAINPGNSGGPLLNLKGEVIGVNTAVASGAENIGFTIPINQAKRDIESVKTTGTIKVPYLGVRYVTVNSELAANEKLPVSDGALVRASGEAPAVVSNSPAAKAGLKSGDIIVELNNEKLTTYKTLGSLIQKYDIGATVNLKVIRGSATLELKTVLEERPEL